jgi:eukaryotic-like serine/threonine-protein kinase
MPRARRQCPTCLSLHSASGRFCPFDGQPLIEATRCGSATGRRNGDPLIGKVVDDRYEVLAIVGEGGMGTVYEVRHRALNRRFALKVLRPEVSLHDDAIERFMQEARAAASIGHDHIVAVSDFGAIPSSALGGASDRDLPYFVMELLVGESLARLLKRESALPPPRAAELVLQCAEGLAAAHDAGVVHRDLKPDNVFVTTREGAPVVKLVDFGVAKMAGASKLTKKGMVYGTPHYMSPEQASGSAVDHRADIYALGVILYECLSGRVPFEADTFMGVLTQHMFAEPRPLELVMERPEALGALGPIVMRCLAKRREDRFQSMAELSAVMQRAVSDPKSALALFSDRPPPQLNLREVEDPRHSRFPRALPELPVRLRWRSVATVIGIAGAVGFAALIGWGGAPGSDQAASWRPPEEARPGEVEPPGPVAGDPPAGRPPAGPPRPARLIERSVDAREALPAPSGLGEPEAQVSPWTAPDPGIVPIPAGSPGDSEQPAIDPFTPPAPPSAAPSIEIVDPWD